MFCRRIFGVLVLTLLSVLAPMFGSGARAAGERVVTASIDCARVPGSDSTMPDITVMLDNQSGLTLHIAYLHSFGAGPNLDNGLTGLKLEDPAVDGVIELEDGQSAVYKPEWAGGDLRRSDKIVALIVTSAGILLPSCDEESHTRTIAYQGETPKLEGEEAEESARIAALTIGQLESWRAYPALYAMLYPDAQHAISFEQIACWYAERFGPPVNDDVNTIHSTQIGGIDWESWTWNVTGEVFSQSAAITYTQEIGPGEGNGEFVEAVMHLVRVDGIWRWFFGSSAAGVQGLASDCGLPATT